MKKLLLTIFGLVLLSVGLMAQTITPVPPGGNWSTARGIINANDEVASDSMAILQLQKAPLASPTFTGTVSLPATWRINGVTITSNGQELNVLDGALVTYQELNKLVGIGTDTIATRAYARSVGGGGGGTGSVTVGNGTASPFFDGSSDGGQILYFYGNNGFWTALQGGAPTANRSYRLPIAALPSAGTTSLLNIDEYGNMGFVASTTYAPLNAPQFTGVPRISTDTIATRAYARSIAGGDVSALTSRVDSIVNVLADTVNIEALIQIDFDTDSIATKAYARSVGGGGTGSIDSLILNGGSLTISGDDRLTFETNGNASYNLPAGGGNLTIMSEVQGWINDSLDVVRSEARLLADTIPIFVFGAGGANEVDTASFTTSTIYGAFYNSGSDTIRVTELRAVMVAGTTPLGTDTLSIQVYWNDTINVTGGGAVRLNTDPWGITNVTTGAVDTSFANAKIPPGVWVFMRSPGVVTGRKPKMLLVTLTGYKIPRY